jgi:hypothetical protein
LVRCSPTGVSKVTVLSEYYKRMALDDNITRRVYFCENPAFRIVLTTLRALAVLVVCIIHPGHGGVSSLP